MSGALQAGLEEVEQVEKFVLEEQTAFAKSSVAEALSRSEQDVPLQE